MPIAGQDFRCDFGVCTPLNSATLSVYKELQTLVNRALVQRNVNLRIDVDGEIGAQTAAGMRAAYAAGFPAEPNSPDYIAANANAYVLAYKHYLPSNPISEAWEWLQGFFNKPVSTPRPATPSTPNAAPAPSASGMPSSAMLLLAGGGLLLYALSKRKKRQK